MAEDTKATPILGKKVLLTTQQVKWMDMEVPTIYSNVVTMGITPFDIVVVLGEIDSATQDDLLAKPRVKLIATPEHAAILVKGLQLALQQFAEGNGPLRTAGQVKTEVSSDEG